MHITINKFKILIAGAKVLSFIMFVGLLPPSFPCWSWPVNAIPGASIGRGLGGIEPPFPCWSWPSEVSKMVWHLKIGLLVQKLEIFYILIFVYFFFKIVNFGGSVFKKYIFSRKCIKSIYFRGSVLKSIYFEE